MNRTRWFILIGTVTILGMDAYFWASTGIDSTISRQMIDMAYTKPYGALIPFGWGFLMGHFFG